MWTFVEADMVKMLVDQEQHTLEPLWQGLKHHQEDCDYFILQSKTTAILRVMLGVSLGASLLQVRDTLQFPGSEVPNSATAWPIEFASKSLTSMETYYYYTEQETLGILHGLEKFHHLWGKCNYRSQTTGSDIQERCCKPITQASQNTTKNTQVQPMNTIQPQAKAIHCRIAIKTQQLDKKRWNARHVHCQ